MIAIDAEKLWKKISKDDDRECPVSRVGAQKAKKAAADSTTQE